MDSLVHMSRFSISSHPGDKMLELLLSPFSCQFYPKFRPFSGQQLKNRVKFGHLSCHSYITELDIYLLVYKRISYIKLSLIFGSNLDLFFLNFMKFHLFSQSTKFGHNSGHFSLMARIRVLARSAALPLLGRQWGS